MKSILTASLLTLTASFVHAAIPRPLGLHQFDNDTLENSIFGGSAATATAFTATFANDTIGGQTARVLTVPSLSSITQRLVLPTPGGGNGGGSFMNNYSVVMDVKLPALPASGQVAALFQTNTGNTNDAEVHLNSSGQIILSGVTNQISSTASVAANTWTRIAITCGSSFTNSPLTVRAYLNGVLVFENTSQSFDGRYSLDPTALLFADNNGETAAISCNSIGFWNRHLTSDQIAALGTPSAVGLTSLLVENANPSGPDSLSAAVTAAANAATASGPDSIGFVSSLSGQTLTLASQIVINDNSPVTIDATALPRGFTISGNNATRLFFMDSGNSLLLRGLTLTAGNGTGSGNNNNFGGAINNNGGVLTLADCTLSGNSASGSGGAIFNNNGFLNLSNSTFFENSATTNGGAISNGGNLGLTHCTFSGNSAQFGGAVFSNNGSNPTINRSTISGNTATDAGGGIFTSGTLNLANTIVAGNKAVNGPDIFRDPSGPSINASGVNLLSNLTGSLLTASSTVLVGDPKLSPLGHFGGPVQTMHPLIGSPAIDAAGNADPGGTDARGFPRFVTGVGNNPQLDIGALEAGPIRIVSNIVDGNLNTLRETISLSVSPGSRIGFSSSFNNSGFSTFFLLGGELAIAAGRSIFIDASDISGGFTISGNNDSRVFNIPATATVAMHSLKIVGGNAVGGGDGGGVHNSGILNLLNSSISNNIGRIGGGLFNNTSGVLALTQCTLSGNSANRDFNGGGLHNRGTLRMIQCTVTGNSAFNAGGFDNDFGGSWLVDQSTITGNLARNGQGGISSIGGSNILKNSIVAGNGASNILGTFAQQGVSLLFGDPLLAPLDFYGGPTQTMALRPGSPARNAATGSTAFTDQRGFPMIGTPDIGAYEAGNALLTNFNAFIWETLPATATPAQATAGADFDGDGTSNEFEFFSQTSPADASSRFAITAQPISVTINSGQTATFTIAAVGNAPSFQWFLGNPGDITNPITGATFATFQTTPLTANTLFWVRVRSGASNLDSASVTATVISPPRITTGPKSKTIKKGKKAKLTVIATGSTLTFQWFKGKSGNTKSPVKNARAATFKTPKLTATTIFWVRITNSAGTVDSKTVAVKVR